MPNEPLAPHLILADLPDEADYEAAYAALMATERGRRFLSDYAGRNRNADTTMVVAAIARVEAAIRGGAAPQPGAASGDLVEIAAALDRLHADIAAGEAQTPDISGAIERIQDIAFVLHERPVEQTLCDGLDAAIREIAGTQATASTQGGSGIAQLIAALADRVRGMIAPAWPQSEALPQSPATESADAELADMGSADASAFVAADAPNHLEAGNDPAMPKPEQLFDFAEGAGEAFADAVTSLAASLPQPAAVAEQTIVAETAAQVTIDVEVTAEANIAATGENEAHGERFDIAAGEAEAASEPAAVHRETDGSAGAETADDATAAIPADDEVAGASSSAGALSSEDILNQALSLNGHFVRMEPFGGERSPAVSPAGARPREEAALPSASGAAVPSMHNGPAQEEADDLFDPTMPVPTPVAASPPSPDSDAVAASPPIPAPAPEAAATPRPVAPPPPRSAAVAPPPAQTSPPMTATAQTIVPSSHTISAPTSQPNGAPVAAPVATMAMPRLAPRPPAADPLAAVRALSEEEVIALFS